MKILSIILISIMSCMTLNAQSIDEELGFIYVKADYLLETDRYEDAIKEFTKIIAKDPTYKDALYKRAKAKYAIAAFKGTKKDLLQAFELVGITPESLELFGKAQKNLDEHDASETTLKTSSMISGNSRTSSASGNDKRNNDNADEEEEKGGLGSLEDQLSSILEDLLPDRKTDEEGTDTTDGGTTTTTTTNTEDGTSTGSSDDDDEEVILDEKKEPEVDNSVNKIYIDEDLTIEIRDGIGGRKILQQPNILILSDKSGEVSVDVCINANGKVESAEYNKNNSTISTQSLVSLAVRKSKEFWFKKSDNDNACGTILFKISGGS